MSKENQKDSRRLKAKTRDKAKREARSHKEETTHSVVLDSSNDPLADVGQTDASAGGAAPFAAAGLDADITELPTASWSESSAMVWSKTVGS